MKITNNSCAVQGVHTLGGIAFLKPGETRENLELSDGQARQAGRLKFLVLVGKPSNDTPKEVVAGQRLEIPPNEIDQLRWQIEAQNAEVVRLTNLMAERDAELSKFREAKSDEPVKTPADVLAMATDATVQFMSFKAAATKLLGDKTPSKKDEIVAALEELATQP